MDRSSSGARYSNPARICTDLVSVIRSHAHNAFESPWSLISASTMILLHDVARLAFSVLFELVQPKVRQLYDPSGIHQTVGCAQRAVIFYDGLVQIDHALKRRMGNVGVSSPVGRSSGASIERNQLDCRGKIHREIPKERSLKR